MSMPPAHTETPFSHRHMVLLPPSDISRCQLCYTLYVSVRWLNHPQQCRVRRGRKTEYCKMKESSGGILHQAQTLPMA